MNHIEHELRNQLRDAASTIADSPHLPGSLRDRIHRRNANKNRLVAGVAAAVTLPAAAVAIAQTRRVHDAAEVTLDPVATTWTLPADTPAATTAAMSIPPATTAPVVTFPAWDGSPSMPLAGPSQMSCVTGYTLDHLAERGFAFDGTVVAIEPPAIAGTLPGGELDPLPFVNATFEVHEWFKAGDSTITTMTVAMPPPDDTSAPNGAAWWGVGSRLLVTGESRWGTDPLDGPVAWMCGFSRTYDPATANAWRTQLAGG